ncbi:transcription termination factor NusA [Akkermansiaceae bacterium]|jgi:N utilization substance protein A|nr:transcription termination factor NusA [Akkermansiaceae bacterium]MDB4382858.1 transcription termination factor NusA [Akkermansiaceae bacterium]MDB4423457.1 transcription termination factor NusA [bacterium]MDB4501969.1 transcription termination factor NusA [Akkermansiaceae bacterium]MDF1714901.1 transcription termination factor NusA [Akkermansiaceae bacterium]
MTTDIVALIEFYEKEKAIDRERVVEALEYAFCSAYRKMVPGADAIETLRAEINEKKGDTRIFASLEVVADDDYIDKFNEVPVGIAQKKDATAEIGSRLDFDVTPKNFGRIAVQTAKQTMMQRLRQAEKEKIYDEFKDRAGDIVSGSVRRFEKSDVMVDLGKFEARMPSKERVGTEDYSVGDRIRCYVVSVDNEGRGPEIILSRSHPNFVRRLFESEVAEISDRTVELRAVAREAGYRTKVAVYTHDDKVDPVGACVGLRGARVKNIVRELNNERVDIIRWNDDVAEFVTEALKPAVVRSLSLDEENRVVNVTVDEEDLSKAIGRRGQNARLTSKLTGWDVQVRKDESQHEQFVARVDDAATHLAGDLGIDPAIAGKLFRAGGVTVDMVAQMPAEYISSEIGVELEEAIRILNAAKGEDAAPEAAEAPAEVSEEAPAETEAPAEETTEG